MFIARGRGTRRGFTLLEITLAVAILALMSIAIYRFVATNITVLRISAQENERSARYLGFMNLLAAQWQTLTPGNGALAGDAVRVNDQSRDEITWTAGAGPGLLTRYAPGDFRVSMRLRRVSDKNDKLEIALSRKPKQDAADSKEHETWISLLPDVQSLQVRYFDPRMNSWVERWTDTVTLPRLIKVTVGRADASVPWEAIIALGRTPF